MYTTFYLLTATWAVGAPEFASSYAGYTYTAPQPLPQAVQQAAPQERLTPSPAPAPASAITPAPAPAPTRFRDRLRHLFSPHHTDPAVTPASTYGVYPGMSSWQKSPADLPPGLRSIQTHFRLSKDDLAKVGHEKDYSWLTGKLFHVPDGSSRWVICYAGPYEVDRYEGIVLLAPTSELARFKDGDLVCVHGRITHGPSPKPLAGAIYQVESINRVGQPTP